MSARLRRQVVALVALAVLPACNHTNPVASTPPPSVHPSIVVQSLTVIGEQTTSGYRYRTVLHLRETAGTTATISAVDLMFLAADVTTVAAHHEQPISSSASVCPASGAVDTRELVTVDSDASHPYATRVQGTVVFNDATGWTNTATAAADVPPASGHPPPPTTAYILTGVISDATTHAGIGGARLEVLGGVNVGKTATTDATGTYALRDLQADSFRLRASADGYELGEQGVTIPDNRQADFTLRRVGACSYTADLVSHEDVPATATQYWVTITRTSGDCVWSASVDASWIAFVTAPNGSGDARLTYVVSQNTTGVSRVGTITVAWSGGSVRLSITQMAGCSYTLPNAIDVAALPGTQYSLNLTRQYGTCSWQATAASWIQLATASGSGDAILRFSVLTNPDNAKRTGGIVVSWPNGFAVVTVTQAPLAAEVCWYTTSPVTLTHLPPSGGPFQVYLTRTSGSCPWQASSNASWLTISSGSGSGNGALIVSAPVNSATTSRSATVTLDWAGGSTRLDFTQDGDIPCTYAVSPQEIWYSLGGSPNGVSIQITTSRAGCPWTASTPDDWIHIGPTGGHSTSGTANGSITPGVGVVGTRSCVWKGVVNVRWEGGGADVLIFQPLGAPRDVLCSR